MYVCCLVNLILLEPFRHAIWVDTCLDRRIVQLNNGVPEPVPFSLTDACDVSANAISKSHERTPPSTLVALTEVRSDPSARRLWIRAQSPSVPRCSPDACMTASSPPSCNCPSSEA